MLGSRWISEWIDGGLWLLIGSGDGGNAFREEFISKLGDRCRSGNSAEKYTYDILS